MLRVGRPHFCCILSGAAASQQPLAVVACCCCCCSCNSAYLRVFARQCYTNGNFEAVCGCLPSAGRDFCYQPRPPSSSRHSVPPVACRLHNEPQPNKVKFIKSTEEKPKRMPKSRKTNENEILSECARVRECERRVVEGYWVRRSQGVHPHTRAGYAKNYSILRSAAKTSNA